MVRLLTVSLLLFSVGIARGDTPIDLSYHPAPAPQLELRGEHLSIESAKALRLGAIAMVLAGIGASIGGLFITGEWLNTPGGVVAGLNGDQNTNLGLGIIAGGAGLIGIGAGMWAYSDYEVRRADGRALPLTDVVRARRSKPLMITGAVFTTLGLALTLSGAITALVPGQHCDDGCAIDNSFVGEVTLGVGSSLLAVGLPMLIVGAHERAVLKRSGFSLDAVAPKLMQGGGGIGLSGRF